MTSDQTPPQGSDPAGEWLTTEQYANVLGITPSQLRWRLWDEHQRGVPPGQRTIALPDWPPDHTRSRRVPLLWKRENVAGAARLERVPPDVPGLLRKTSPDDLWCGPKMGAKLLGWAESTFRNATTPSALAHASARRRLPEPVMFGRHPRWRLGALRAFRADLGATPRRRRGSGSGER